MTLHLLPSLRAERGSFEPMSALDAAFLQAETDRSPMHIGSLAWFDGAPFLDEAGEFRIDEVRSRVAAALDLVPRLRQRPVEIPFGLGRPVWVDDEEFDITRHVRLTVLPLPGSREQLLARCSQLQMRRLDRSHPLWELEFVGGLHDDRVAVIERVHHAMADGIGGVDIAAALFDLTPDAAPPAETMWEPVAAPSGIALLNESALERVSEPLAWWRSVRALLPGPHEIVEAAEGLTDGVASFVTGALHGSTSINQEVGTHRTLCSISVELEEVHAAAKRHDATVNDVVLAAVTSGLREALASRGEDPAERPIHALVPVSTRGTEEHGHRGNHVSAIVVELPVGVVSAAERLDLVRTSMAAHKHRHQADAVALVTETLDLAPPPLLRALVPSIHRQPFVHVVVTNVPGPAAPLFFLGAEMLEATPIVPLAGNLTIGIAALSYNGTLTLGLYADQDRWPDLQRLADAIRSGFEDWTRPSDPAG
jgi:WS/DGAT/MGAT family acyltransferase